MYLFIYDIYPTSDRWAWIFTYVVHPWSGHLHSHRCFLLSLSVVCVGYSALTPENIVLQCQRETYDKCLVVTQWQFGNHCQRLFGVGGLVVFLFGCGFHVVHLVGLVVFLHLARGQPTDQDTNKNNVSSSMKYWQVNFHVEKNQTLTTKIPYVERC